MKQEQVRDYVCRYLEATECHVLESSPAYITVKLSPEAAKPSRIARTIGAS